MRLRNSSISTLEIASNESEHNPLWQELSDLESQTVQGGSSQDDDDDKYKDIKPLEDSNPVWYFHGSSIRVYLTQGGWAINDTDATTASLIGALGAGYDVESLG